MSAQVLNPSDLVHIGMSEQDYKKATSGANRYVMGYSESEDADMIVYADSIEEAEEKFEDGLFVYEDWK